MSSNNLSIEDGGSLDVFSEVFSNKETQTSSTYITDSFDLVKGPSRPLPKGIDKADVDTKVQNILLDCQVLKDPNETKSTELETDESFVKNVNSNPSASTNDVNESPTFLKYCKEVAKPYLKSYLKDCDDYADSLEQLIQDSLEDFPDYQPCYEVYEGKQEIQKRRTNLSGGKMDTIPDKKSNQNENFPKDTSATPQQTNNESTANSPNTYSNTMNPDSQQNEVDLLDDNIKDPNKCKKTISIESITKYVKDSLTSAKQTTSCDLDTSDVVIGIKKSENSNEKPTYFAMEKPKVEGTSSQNVQTEVGNSLNNIKTLLYNPSEKIATFTGACKDFAENLINNHNDKICAMKETCKDFAENLLNNPDEKIHVIKETCKEYADKFYNSSKDAAVLIKTESAKLLAKSYTALNDYNSNENQPKQNEKLRNIGADSVTSLLFKKAENKPLNDEPLQDNAVTVPSRITDEITFGVKLSFNKVKENIVTAKFEKSSPYDVVVPKEAVTKPPDPQETRIPTVSAIDHPDPPTSSNVFDIIRSKIFSIFRDDGEKSPEMEPTIQENNEEEDPFERFMEQ